MANKAAILVLPAGTATAVRYYDVFRQQAVVTEQFHTRDILGPRQIIYGALWPH